MNLAIENNLGVDLTNVLMVLVSTLIIIFIAKKYFWNVVLEYLKKREQFLASEYEIADVTKKEAIKLKKDYEEKMQHAHHEANEVIQDAKQKAQLEYQDVLKKAKQDASNVLSKAKDEIEFEKRKAEKEMNNKIKDIAFMTAEQLMKKEISESTKQNFVDEFLSQVNE